MSKAFMVMICFAIIVVLAVVASADTLMLKDGRVLAGTFMKGTASAIEFEADGSTKTYPLSTIISLTFQRTEPAPNIQQDQTKVPPATAQGGTINAGTRLMVRTETALVTGQVKSGDRFTALLEADVVVGGNLIAAQGSTVYGRVAESKKAKRVVVKAKLVIEMTYIMIGGQLYPLVTDQIGYEGERSGTLKKIALGAATGGVIDGSDGAKTGAAVGAGVAVMTKGKQIEVPAKSILEFTITQPLQIR